MKEELLSTDAKIKAEAEISFNKIRSLRINPQHKSGEREKHGYRIGGNMKNLFRNNEKKIMNPIPFPLKKFIQKTKHGEEKIRIYIELDIKTKSVETESKYHRYLNPFSIYQPVHSWQGKYCQ